MKALVVVLVAALAVTAGAFALETSRLRYGRTLTPASAAAVRFEPDGPLYSHAQQDFGDLRIVDADGKQVPWRTLPQRAAPAERTVTVLNAGRQHGQAVALLDLGPRREVRDRVRLDVPDNAFVGRVTVSGSDDRKTFTLLSRSVIYDIKNAASPARSTAAVFPPSDFRYLSVRASGVSRIDGATVSTAPVRARLIERHGAVRRTSANPTRLVLDLGYRNVPVDQLYLTAATPRYNRAATVEGSNSGHDWSELARTRVFRLTRSVSSPIDLAARDRYLRVTIFNGDDEPLRGIRLSAFAQSRAVLAEAGHRGPLRVLYGDPLARSPKYDFALLPRSELNLAHARIGRLGLETRNAGFEPRPDTRSYTARHPELVSVALAVAAVAVALGGFLALRRRGTSHAA
jgi:hypothetical protein